MKIYKLAPEGFEQALAKTLPSRIMCILIALFMGAYIIGSRGQLSALVLAITIPVVLAVTGIGLYNGIKRQREHWLAYQLLLDDKVITRKQAHLPDIEIRRDQVVKIQENPGTGMIVKTSNKRKFIAIPVSLEGYEEVKKWLADWQVCEPLPRQTFQKFWPMLADLCGGAALTITLVSENSLIVLPAGVIFCIGMVWSLIEIQRNPHVGTRTKRIAWFCLLPLSSVVCKLLVLLF